MSTKKPGVKREETESSCEKNTYIVKYIRNAQETYSNFLYEGKAEEG